MKGPLVEGHVYKITYTLEAGNYRTYKYEAVMTYLGGSTWNLRPLAGTQTLDLAAVISAEDLGVSNGRSDHRHRMKRSLGEVKKS